VRLPVFIQEPSRSFTPMGVKLKGSRPHFDAAH
jgi:hypothetical protein